jgi:transcription-repair coupling factor (superfamily II helicase)
LSLPQLLPLLAQEPPVAAALADAATATGALDIVAPAGLVPPFAAALCGASAGPVVLVTATTRQSEDLAAAVAGFLPAESVAVFPSWETLPHERLSPSADVVGRRLAVLRRLVHPGGDPATGRPRLVVAPVRALLQPVFGGLADLEPVALQVGDEMDPADVARALVRIGYTRCDLVERRGQFAVRGGILDTFPPTEEHPVRIEFWGDTVEEVRSFAVADQRSLDPLPRGLWAPPCRELPFTDEVRQRARNLVARHPELTELLDAIADGRGAEGIEALSPLLADRMDLVIDLLPAGSRVLLAEPQRIADRAVDLLRTSEEFLAASWHNLAMSDGGRDRAPIDLAGSAYRELAEVRSQALARDVAWIGISPFGGDVDSPAIADPAPHFQADLSSALSILRTRAGAGAATVVVASGQGTAKRLTESFGSQDIPTGAWSTGAPLPAAVNLTVGQLDTGFHLPATDVLVLTDADLFGAGASGRGAARMPAKRRRAIDPLSLRAGDFVVHDKHGVGRYVEMTTRTMGGTTREYMVVEYAPGKRGHPPDKLFLPTDQLDEVTRYIGGEAPSLHKLGGSDWAAAKGRARKAVKQIAGELIRLYAARQHAQGYSFAPDSPWQAELEDSFGFVETPDQLSTINEVKADMEKTVPMDRLVCGDVGYGKTEIAVRAAFKAIQDGKQVALLVPTTLLVQQHLKTFTQRYAAFPVTIAALSRFTSAADAKQTLAGLADGSIDLAIGTHSLLSAKVRFKDLGLVIIDEEQRFGVEHKEHLKC